jgi:hypothetical protein
MLEIGRVANRRITPNRMARRHFIRNSDCTQRDQYHDSNGRHRKDKPQIKFRHKKIFSSRVPNEVKHIPKHPTAIPNFHCTPKKSKNKSAQFPKTRSKRSPSRHIYRGRSFFHTDRSLPAKSMYICLPTSTFAPPPTRPFPNGFPPPPRKYGNI